MIMLIGQVARDQFDREAFQEIDYRRMFGQVAKWVGQIEDAERIPEYVARAYHTAMSGRPGPVVLALPEDMLRDRVAVSDTAPYAIHRSHPGDASMQAMRGMLAEAERPLLLVGGGGWDQAASDNIQAFAKANNIHPGIVVGQLQHRNELTYAQLKGLQEKYRDRIVGQCLSDGWGTSISVLG